MGRTRNRECWPDVPISNRATAAAHRPASPDFQHSAIRNALSAAPSAFADWDVHSTEQHALHELFRGSMRGANDVRLPFVAPGSGRKVTGVQVTDSATAALSIERFCPNCDRAWNQLEAAGDGVCVLHCRGAGANAGKQIFWFPHNRTMWAYGAGYDVTGLLHAIDATRAVRA